MRACVCVCKNINLKRKDKINKNQGGRKLKKIRKEQKKCKTEI